MSIKQSEQVQFKGKLKDSLFWWLGKKKPFFANDDYMIELLHIDQKHYSVKIRVTNLKNNTVQTIDAQEQNNEQR